MSTSESNLIDGGTNEPSFSVVFFAMFRDIWICKELSQERRMLWSWYWYTDTSETWTFLDNESVEWQQTKCPLPILVRNIRRADGTTKRRNLWLVTEVLAYYTPKQVIWSGPIWINNLRHTFLDNAQAIVSYLFHYPAFNAQCHPTINTERGDLSCCHSLFRFLCFLKTLTPQKSVLGH